MTLTPGNSSGLRVARIVSIASRSGKYGGPFDTASRQVELARRENMNATVIAGFLADDEPVSREYLTTRKVRKYSSKSFVLAHSLPLCITLVKEIKAADVVHISFAREAIPISAAFAARILRRDVILQPHGMLTSRSSPIHRLIDMAITRRVMGRRAVILALTENEAEELKGWSTSLDGRLQVMGNPAPIDLESLPDDRPLTGTALFAARLHPRKRVADFASAATIAHDAGWRDTYEVLGPDEGDLAALQRTVATVPNLNYLGATSSDGVLDHLRRAGVFVLPSANEPWGNVLIAAIRLGVPVVVTRSAVLAKLIDEHGAGVVVDDGSPAQIAAAVHHILDAAMIASYRSRARTLGQRRFSDRQSQHELGRLYTAVSSRGRGRETN